MITDASQALCLCSNSIVSSLAATAGVRKKKKKEWAMWRQANLKAIIDHQPPWLVWLQCARCNWLGRAIRSFNRKYTLSLSIAFKKWQQREETQLPEATVSNKNWIYCSRPSNAESYNQTKRFCVKLYLFLKSHSISGCFYLSLQSFLLVLANCLKSTSNGTRCTLLLRDGIYEKKREEKQSK